MVSRSSLRTLVVALFAAVLVSCEPATEIVAPIEQPAEELAPQQLGPGVPEFKRTVIGPTGQPITLGESIDGAEISGWIDRKGGFLFLPADKSKSCTLEDVEDFFDGDVGKCHVLFVSEGAVKKRTYFTMRRVAGNHVQVDLTATSQKALKKGRENDVGKKGFRAPVYLLLNYGAVDIELEDDDELGIAWLKRNGKLTGVRSFINDDEEVALAELRHFSGYILVRL